nr:GNAT family N-acetyltransferase [Leptospira weilii]
MVLETERLVLREWKDGDIEPFYQMSSDPIVMEYFPALLSKNDSERFFEKIKAHLKMHVLVRL